MAHKEITSDLESIEEILINTKETYFIPEYQRNFVWGRDEVRQLFDDFREDTSDFSAETSTLDGYLLGNIVLIDNDDNNSRIVIDGQQRLTTLTLIARVLYKEVVYRIKENPNNTMMWMQDIGSLNKSYAIKLDDGSFKSLKIEHDNGLEFGRIYRRIITQEDENEIDFLSDIETEGDKNVYEVYSEIFEQVRNFETTQLRRFLIYFRTKIKLIVTCAPNESRAFQLFEILNDRGKSLEPMDLIKNTFLKIIYESNNHILQENFTENWKKMIRNLHDGKRKLSTSTFLKYFILSYWGRNEKNADLYDFFRNKCTLTAEEISKVVKEMSDKSNVYAEIEKSRYEAFVQDNNMFVLFKLLKIKQLHPILMMFYDVDKEKKIEILDYLVRLGAAVVFAFVQTNKIERMLENLANSYLEKAKTDKNKAYDDMLSVLSQSIETHANEVRTSLAAKNLVGESGNANTKAATILKFIELFYNENVDVINKKKITVEHILSKQINLGMYNISYNELGFQDKIDFDNNKHRIGNLTLLIQDENSSLKNKCFAEKKAMYKNSCFNITSTIVQPLHTEIKNGAESKLYEKINKSERQYGSNNKHWNINLINERGSDIANLLYCILTRKTNIDNNTNNVRYGTPKSKKEVVAESIVTTPVMRKVVKKKLLTSRFTVSNDETSYFISNFPDKMKPGDSIPIKLLFNGNEYSAYVVYVKFSEENRRNKPVLQIRYSNKDGFLDALQKEFHAIYECVLKGARNIPTELRSYLDFYTTKDLYTFKVVAVKSIG